MVKWAHPSLIYLLTISKDDKSNNAVNMGIKSAASFTEQKYYITLDCIDCLFVSFCFCLFCMFVFSFVVVVVVVFISLSLL